MNSCQNSSPSERAGVSCAELSNTLGISQNLHHRANIHEKVEAELKLSSKKVALELNNGSSPSGHGFLKLLYTEKEVRIALGVSRSKFHSMRKIGQFPTGLKIGSLRRWHAADIYSWLEQLRIQGEKHESV